MKQSWLAAAGSSALLLGLFACSGEDSANGINGKDGVDGKDGESCIVETLKKSSGYKVLCDGDSVGVLLSGHDGKDGVDGTDGVNGTDGKDGASCLVSALTSKDGYKVLCGGDSVGVLLNGAAGESCLTTTAEDGVAITCGASTVIVKDGKSCTAAENAAKTGYVLTCGGEVVGTILHGKDGKNGINGSSCSAVENAAKTGYTLTCDGVEVGTILNGKNGSNGSSCSAVENEAKTGYILTCDGKEIGTILNGLNGKDGESCSAVENATKTGYTLSCGDKVIGDILHGEKGIKGANGTSCSATENEAKTGYTLSCDGKVVGTILHGTNGTSCSAVENATKTGFVLSCDGKEIGTILHGTNGTSCSAVENAAKTGYTLSCGGVVVGDILNGTNGGNGTSCSAVENAAKTGFLLTCDGVEVGTIFNGTNGDDGKSCSAVEKADHSGFIMSCGGVRVGEISNGRGCTAVPYTGEDGTGYTVTCGDVSGNILNGAKGDACVAEDYSGADGVGFTIKCGGKEAGKILNGSNGTNCTAVKNASGNFELSCAGTSVGTITNGKDGVGCSLVDNGNGTATQTCGETSITLYKAMCGTIPYDPALSFCNDGTVIGYCGEERTAYDPTVKFCNSNNELADLCNGKKYNSDQKCESNVILSKCGTETNFWYYDSTRYFCAMSDFVGQKVVIGKCNSVKYNPNTETCSGAGTVLPFCGATDAVSQSVSQMAATKTSLCTGATFMNASFVGTCDAAGISTMTTFFNENKYAVFYGKTYDPNTKFCQETETGKVTQNLCGLEKRTYTKDQFCRNGVVYDLCGGNEYDAAAEFCDAGTVRDLCNGNTFDGTSQRCNAGVVEDLCGAASLNQYYDASRYFCADGKVFSKCNGESYNTNEKVCYANTLYDYCGVAQVGLSKSTHNEAPHFVYNENGDYTIATDKGTTYYVIVPLTEKNSMSYNAYRSSYVAVDQFCHEGKVFNKCGGSNGSSYNPSTEFCDAGTVRELCGGYEFSNASQFCLEGKVYERCGTENNGEYDPTTTTCVDQIQRPFCKTRHYTSDTYGETLEEAKANSEAAGYVWYGSTAKKGYQTCFVLTTGSGYVVACPNAYDPETQFCQEDKWIKELCGSSKQTYDHTYFCDVNGTVLKFCDGEEYDGANQFCDARSSHIYGYKNFNGKIWMTDNLHYADDFKYPNLAGASECGGGRCSKYGVVYTWAAAMNLPASANTSYQFSATGFIDEATGGYNPETPYQGICPDGWHIPTYAEQAALLSYATSWAAIHGGNVTTALLDPSISGSSSNIGFNAIPPEGGMNAFWGTTEWHGYMAEDYNGETEHPTGASMVQISANKTHHTWGATKSNYAYVRCVKN